MDGNRMRVVELFCGIGGFRLAADSAGLTTVWANDINEDSCKVYSNRFGSTELVQGDIADLIGVVPPHDLLTAGFPCQSFSTAGKKLALGDDRGGMLAHIFSIVKRHLPRWIVLENVPTILTMKSGEGMAAVLSGLTDAGYHVQWRLLEASRFGLAQKRKRMFFVASRLPLADMPMDLPDDQAAGSKVVPWGSARFPQTGKCHISEDGRVVMSAPKKKVSGPCTVFKRASVSDILDGEVHLKYDMTASTKSRMDTLDKIDKTIQGVHILANKDKGQTAGYTIYATDGLSPTLTCNSSRVYERYAVGDRFRRLTPVEYARLQGFPDDHCAVLPEGRQYRVIGNAVPPPMASWVLQAVARADASMSGSLCLSCANCRLVKTERSVFYLCRLHASDPGGYPKYPRQPVLSCRGYTDKIGV